MVTSFNTVTQSAPDVLDSLGTPSRSADRRGSTRIPSIQSKILAQLAPKATDARGYAALQVTGHDAAEIDEALEVLHRAGLLNAFFVNRSASPRFHPSSLTREGRRIHDQDIRVTGA
jgi:hypothetical protein